MQTWGAFVLTISFSTAGAHLTCNLNDKWLHVVYFIFFIFFLFSFLGWKQKLSSSKVCKFSEKRIEAAGLTTDKVTRMEDR